YVMEHHPDVRKEISAAIDKAAGQREVADQAYTLRTALDAVRTAIGKTKAPAPPVVAKVNDSQPGKPLWDRLGGEAGVRKVVDDLVDQVASDPKVNFTRKGTGKEVKMDDKRVAELKSSLVEFISSATGGPLMYTGLTMKTAHLGLGISDAE